MVPAEQWAKLLRPRPPKPGNTHHFSTSAQELSWTRLSQSCYSIANMERQADSSGNQTEICTLVRV